METPFLLLLLPLLLPLANGRKRWRFGGGYARLRGGGGKGGNRQAQAQPQPHAALLAPIRFVILLPAPDATEIAAASSSVSGGVLFFFWLVAANDRAFVVSSSTRPALGLGCAVRVCHVRLPACLPVPRTIPHPKDGDEIDRNGTRILQRHLFLSWHLLCRRWSEMLSDGLGLPMVFLRLSVSRHICQLPR